MGKQRVVNAVMGRELFIDEDLFKQNEQFFKGWASATGRITPRDTFDRVDSIMGRNENPDHVDERGALNGLVFEWGVLFGRVETYQALIYLNAECKLDDRLFSSICDVYK